MTEVKAVIGARWAVWHVQCFDRSVSWHAAPLGSPIAVVDASSPELLLAGCRAYEAGIAEHMEATRIALGKLMPLGQSGIDDDTRAVLHRLLRAQLNLQRAIRP